MKIFVGNIAFAAKDGDIKKAFEIFGMVESISIKKKSGENSRGFGFVVMPDEVQAQAAIAGLDGKELMGRLLSVTVGRSKPEKPKKDYKEIKRLRQEAKADGLLERLGSAVVEEVKPAEPKRGVVVKKLNAPSGSKAWIKRKGTGKAKPWKKTPGGIKKKFKSER